MTHYINIEKYIIMAYKTRSIVELHGNRRKTIFYEHFCKDRLIEQKKCVSLLRISLT